MIPQIICVVGPTATGKTKMGVALARRFGGEVVSVDSMQIYRGMAIGTAAPTPEEMEGIPHHMVGVADPPRAGPWPGSYRRPTPACRISSAGAAALFWWAARGCIWSP